MGLRFLPLSQLPSMQAMGNYPWPSSYILNGAADMPAFPVRAACSYLAKPELQGAELLAALAQAIGIFHNATGACLSLVCMP